MPYVVAVVVSVWDASWLAAGFTHAACDTSRVCDEDDLHSALFEIPKYALVQEMVGHGMNVNSLSFQKCRDLSMQSYSLPPLQRLLPLATALSYI